MSNPSNMSNSSSTTITCKQKCPRIDMAKHKVHGVPEKLGKTTADEDECHKCDDYTELLESSINEISTRVDDLVESTNNPKNEQRMNTFNFTNLSLEELLAMTNILRN